VIATKASVVWPRLKIEYCSPEGHLEEKTGRAGAESRNVRKGEQSATVASSSQKSSSGDAWSRAASVLKKAGNSSAKKKEQKRKKGSGNTA